MAAATVAVIPSRYEPERLERLLDLVLPDVDRAIVVDTGHDQPIPERDRLLVVPGDPRASIYRWWNEGWRLAREVAPDANVAILNDDVAILPGTVGFLARALRVRDDVGAVYPDPTVPFRGAMPGRIRLDIDRDPLGGREMTGYCFVARGDLPIEGPFDEAYGWWYGDTQFDEAVRLLGYGVARVNRVPVEHTSDAERGGWSRRPELRAIAEADGRRFDSLHVRVIDGRWWPVSERYG